ncbi:hypothetical protein [Streptomyces aureoverticillatus]|uniref:hypothetical protein n=1 Tax=Streptomyces aureoverticillatus TaxID=66871 RepID=UPI0013DAE391|nr:hypothetical protein [Streptomyces aureoverticillatus]QIB44572.1 hypothetical protein G3H79_17285 [Streptomyces aureoverticillatus]
MAFEPLTEHRPVLGPHVYGYLRHGRGRPSRRLALAESLSLYCSRHELTLCGVFTDADLTTRDVGSAAFTGVLDVLALPDTYGLVIPARSHLGPRRVAAARERRLVGLDVRLMMVRPPQVRRVHSSAGPPGKWRAVRDERP